MYIKCGRNPDRNVDLLVDIQNSCNGTIRVNIKYIFKVLIALKVINCLKQQQHIGVL